MIPYFLDYKPDALNHAAFEEVWLFRTFLFTCQERFCRRFKNETAGVGTELVSVQNRCGRK